MAKTRLLILLIACAILILAFITFGFSSTVITLGKSTVKYIELTHREEMIYEYYGVVREIDRRRKWT